MDKFEDIIEDIFPDINYSKVQGIKQDMNIYEILTLISPGTEIRVALDEILRAQMGALVVLGTNIILEGILRGGLKINTEMNSSTLFELAKMDGAIVLSNDLKKIAYANIHLTPDRNIETKETGIRHRSGEQTAKQTGLPVVAISKRRNIISLYYNQEHYVLHDLPYLTTKADHYLKTISNYRLQINALLNELTYYELNNNSTYLDAIKIILKIIYLEKTKLDLEEIIIELGEEGTQIKHSLQENTFGLRKELSLLVLDYSKNEVSIEKLIEEIYQNKDSLDKDILANILQIPLDKLESLVSVKGYRILYKIPKLSKTNIDKITSVGDLFTIQSTSSKELAKLTGVSEKVAETIKDQINRLTDNIGNKI
jgi:diadenylate cyclase